MAVFQLGSVIKNRREELKISQEDLADGICSVPTLSRIENGERMPTKNHFEMLMQRLGYSAMSLDFFTDKRDFLAHEVKIKLRYAYISENYEQARMCLQEFKHMLEKPTSIDEQFVILYQTLLYSETYTNTEKLKSLEKALKLTCPRYDSNHIPHVLSYEEIILLNNIAICYDSGKNREQAISIFCTLKEYYDHHVISTEEALRTQPMVLYNLSKALGLNGRYDECIAICDLGIHISRKTGRWLDLGRTLFNRGWALLNRKEAGDMEAAKQSLKQAYCFSVAIDNKLDTERINSFYEAYFGESLSV